LLDLRTLSQEKTFETKTTGGANETNTFRTLESRFATKKIQQSKVVKQHHTLLGTHPLKTTIYQQGYLMGIPEIFSWRTGDCRTGLVVRYQGVTTVGGSQLQIGQWFSPQFEKICASQIGSCPRVGVSCHQHGEKNNLLETA